MTRHFVLAILLAPGAAFACGGKPEVAADVDAKTEQVAASAAAVDPTHCAKRTELVGANCSYATGMMAQRVLEEGATWSFIGSLAATDNALDSRVAAPYTVGPDGSINVIANEVVEHLVAAGADGRRLSLTGKVLEVEGVTYFVAQEFAVANS